jgi:UPF0042 nucleotide-binding protein
VELTRHRGDDDNGNVGEVWINGENPGGQGPGLPPSEMLKVTVVSFGYQHGDDATLGAHLVIDLRDSILRPARIHTVNEITSQDPEISRQVLALPGVSHLVHSMAAMTVALHRMHDPDWILTNVAIGSDIGRHRSVVVANELTQTLNQHGITTEVQHRDILKPVADTDP